jgi:DNA-directed RNA polymerase specialized sigma24 family protein
VFNEKLDSLYILSFLLTGDHRKAEECVVASLGDCLQSREVFKEKVYDWAKIAIIKKAIVAVQPKPSLVRSVPPPQSAERFELPIPSKGALHIILALPEFARFVFVMRSLEQYTRHECALLLGCSIAQVQHAQGLAIELIANRNFGASARAQPI